MNTSDFRWHERGDISSGECEEHEQRREESSSPSSPKVAKVYAARVSVLTYQDRRDQVAADREEDLNPEESARSRKPAKVVGDYRKDGQSANPVDAGLVTKS